jgi:excisionase family DNA binding protein
MSHAPSPTTGVARRRWLPAVPRVALTHEEAAKALGVSRDFFDEHLLHDIPHIRRGRRRLFPLTHLERWAQENAARWSD